jgi:adenylate cyclase
VTYMRTPDPAADRAKALLLAQEAAALDSHDPLVLTVLSAAYGLAGEFDLALTAVENALALDPNSAWACLRSGWTNHYSRNPDTAIEHFHRTMRLSPLDPMRFNAIVGRLEEAKRAVAKLVDTYPDMTVTKAIEASPPSAPSIERIAEGLRRAGLPE